MYVNIVNMLACVSECLCICFCIQTEEKAQLLAELAETSADLLASRAREFEVCNTVQHTATHYCNVPHHTALHHTALHHIRLQRCAMSSLPSRAARVHVNA